MCGGGGGGGWKCGGGGAAIWKCGGGGAAIWKCGGGGAAIWKCGGGGAAIWKCGGGGGSDCMFRWRRLEMQRRRGRCVDTQSGPRNGSGRHAGRCGRRGRRRRRRSRVRAQAVPGEANHQLIWIAVDLDLGPRHPACTAVGLCRQQYFDPSPPGLGVERREQEGERSSLRQRARQGDSGGAGGRAMDVDIGLGCRGRVGREHGGRAGPTRCRLRGGAALTASQEGCA